MNQQIVECIAVYNDGEKFGFEIEADFNESSSNIRIRFPMLENEWRTTQYQVADAQHSRLKAAKLAWKSAGDCDGEKPAKFVLPDEPKTVPEFKSLSEIIWAAKDGFEGQCWIRTGKLKGKHYNVLRNNNVVNILKLHIPIEGDSEWRSVYQNVIGPVS